MKGLIACSLFVLMAASLGCAQGIDLTRQLSFPLGTLAVLQDAPAAQSEIRGAFPTTLVKAIDSKKLKEGDTVVCQTIAALHSGSGLLIPSGSKVIGHVTQAQARSKGDADSSLAIVFDKIQITGGKELPLKGTLQAVGPSLGGSNGPDTGPGGGLGMGGNHGNASDTATVPAASNTAVAGPNSGVHALDNSGSRPILNAQSQGVLGIKNLQMDKDSMLSSPGKEVKLDTGTQMLIHAEIQAPVQ